MNYGFGFILGLGVILFLVFLIKKTDSSNVMYDEMQKSVQGQAYKYATIIGTLAGMISAFLSDFRWFPMDGGFTMLTVSLIMVLIYTTYMIIKGAFFGISGKWKLWTAMEFFVGITNTVIGVLNILKDGLRNGKLTMANTNLLIGIVFIIVATAVLIRKALEKKDEV